MLKKLDRYILKKFISTFFFSIGLITILLIVFDISEKLDNFIEHHIPIKEIIFDHYINFIPYFVNTLSPLFIFISVVFFTSKMAARYETVAILSSGVSYARFLRPYMIGAAFFCMLSLFLGHFVIPKGNRIKQEFEDKYINNHYNTEDRNVHRNFGPGFKMSLESYNNYEKRAYNFAMERYKGKQMIWYFTANTILWDSIKRTWTADTWFERYPGVKKDSINSGKTRILKIDFSPDDMARKESKEDVMTYFELKKYIAKERAKGTPDLQKFEVVNYKRTSVPFASFILTLIGVALAARKTRGGIGMHITIGLLVGATYILLLHFCSTFADNSLIPPLLAVWFPNILYSIVALLLIKFAQK
ncbi:MAG: LptF/LptG family permease [Bacteroidia bacterium]|nr:LptF/LptG family permease [Bacteroidia bacterium]